MQRLADIANEMDNPHQCLLAVDVRLVYALCKTLNAWLKDCSLVVDLLYHTATLLAVAVVV